MEKQNTGYLGKLTPEQEIFIKKLQTALGPHLARYPEFNTKWSLLRFCRARNFDLKKTEAMLLKFIKWRDDKDMERIRNIDFGKFSHIIEHHESGRYGVDKKGRPVIIERAGISNTKAIMTDNDVQTIEDYFIQMYERNIFIEFPLASAAVGHRVDETFLIVDLKNVNVMKIFDSKFKEFLKFIAVISQDYYPEILGKMFIVNAPFLFRGIWAVIKVWLDQKTKSKIEMYSDIPLKKIQEYIDIDDLPEFINGKCKCPLNDNHGPWKEAIEDARQRKSFFLNDRTPEYAYFYDEDERMALALPKEEKIASKAEIIEELKKLDVKIDENEDQILKTETLDEEFNAELLHQLAEEESAIILEGEDDHDKNIYASKEM